MVKQRDIKDILLQLKKCEEMITTITSKVNECLRAGKYGEANTQSKLLHFWEKKQSSYMLMLNSFGSSILTLVNFRHNGKNKSFFISGVDIEHAQLVFKYHMSKKAIKDYEILEILEVPTLKVLDRSIEYK